MCWQAVVKTQRRLADPETLALSRCASLGRTTLSSAVEVESFCQDVLCRGQLLVFQFPLQGGDDLFILLRQGVRDVVVCVPSMLRGTRR